MSGMDADGEDMTEVFSELGEVEKRIEEAELKARLHKEFLLRPLYEERQTHVNRIPDFWPQLLGSAPDDFQSCVSDSDIAILASIKSLCIERNEIESATQGDPRSLRFVFEFHPNEYFHDTKLVKDFKHRSLENGSGGLISAPVSIKWKSKKQDVTCGLLEAAVQLHQAEEAIRFEKGHVKIDIVQREALYQYETLRDKIAETETPSFFNWFGYRGAVAEPASRESKSQEGGVDEGDEEEEEDDDLLLDVEIFPNGEEVALALADDLWPNLMDYFMAAQVDPEEDIEPYEIEEADSDLEVDAPELVDQFMEVTEVTELTDLPEENGVRPKKRQRRN